MLGSPCFVQTLPSFTHGLRHTAVIRCLKRCSINITHPQGNATQNRSETSRHTRWDGDGTALESGSSVALSTLEEIREQSSCPPSMDKEQVTGRSFGDKDFRTGLENGILLCELLNAIKPGLVKKINRLPTPIAGLDNIILFLRGCKELGLRESQLFDPSDLQDTSNRVTVKSLDYSRKLKNVLVTIYWLGKAANSSASYSGTTLNLKEFEGLLAQMRKETDDIESPKRSIRDSGYIDCWDSERSDSLSPPRHGRDDSFDSLDSFGSRSRQTPSPDVVLRGSSDGRGSDSESDLPHRKLPDVKKDDMSARRTSHGEPKSAVPFNQYLPNKSNQTAYVPAPLRRRKAEREEYRKSWSTATSPLGGDRPCRYGPRTPVSDDAESSSLLDMRCEEEAAVQPHSRARQEQLQLINSQLREEDDKWQDDLARWKSRRRSASQDLIKKEEERKKMEKLLAGEDGTSERRKSIKTYREIVQEKERRERELHEAYKNARSQEEAEGILQQYIERFTISEAVLERLEMPKILERSHSTEPNLTPFLNDPNPMKYLRRQSLPPPKFTATVETTIARTSVLDTGVSAGGGSPSKTVPPKAVPMLTPKPYSQPKNSQDVLKTFKVDGKVSMNGEAVHGDKEKERECPTVAPAPSLTKPQMFEAVARVHGSPVELKQDNNSIEINIKKPSSVPQELRATTEETEPNSQEDENDGGKTQKGNTELAPSEPQHFTTTVTRSSPTVPFVEFPSSPQRRNDVPPEEDQKKLGNEMSGKVELVLSQKVVKPKSPEPEATLTYPFLEKMSETNQLHLPNLNSQVDSPGSEKSPVTTPFKFWAWDPEEERRRQEKWQQEQERLLQERYQKEQNKLKEEWEKAQKEVEEEERRYYEEERKIIEDTVVPFTLSSSSADQLSTSSSVTEGTGTVSKMDLENCREEEQETKQKKPLRGDDSDLMPKTREDHPLEGKGSLTQGALAPSKNPGSKGVHQDHQLDAETGALRCGMNSQLAQDPPQNTQVSNPPMHVLEDVKPKTLPLDKSINHQIESPSERRKKSPRENFQAGHLSPCSPTPPGQSPNRSISGKKLCSSCGLPLGKGAAMIIETLQLYFHIQCFRCGLCKGQLGDAVSGTDVRIRSGLLNCNDCYLRSRKKSLVPTATE
ncbi:LIM and calponin homology domains-containing protein 1 isoform X8 [Canis lupus familiaris]|uniref:LIM and calponin homology domains-containing protein 1 isoform X8 n=1 Tax=Canis lupus familiaris TaxID=9615 RepID=UPI000BAA2B90|nr:LIM and calponin homology domains-containing protein 1 isoform X8 [Canis lupus familiaris]XP_038411873.1 LIM and calponin homology domains-containing protein 1 isoform X8 [Canis lupus familiaris]XP_038541411.1 LIM and calponin homology domains-containing protein 1 isoform X8 [Canis lupus familiaris]|eukprot:XP_022282636.1 LIM and calponin homology domains-containing protein 1 isoform X4 [Canis lupus familiaris]